MQGSQPPPEGLDSSRDVWVANCFVGGTEKNSNVVRIDAETLAYGAQWLLARCEATFH
jgi:hypothetical protein